MPRWRSEIESWVAASADVRGADVGSAYFMHNATAASRVAERRMGEILCGWNQRQLDIARDLELAQVRTAIGERESSHLDVVFGRDRDLEQRVDLLAALPDHGLVGKERRPVGVRLAAHGL